ncbi:glycosyltransferase family 4 protein [Streptococcus suis]|uniref:glycosyltransferase family 4 protein n=1 Tax=Streptococcus suis TaxID=1307 RepID=UPI000CF47509|nr:glycosyltransferase family 4 protein [Streptococcus suis]HEL2402206.1 glycosyltransferase family 4 protein [Streptococcus suis]
MKKALIVASVASMIGQFNISNIKILQLLGFEVDVAANFSHSGTISIESVQELKEFLEANKVNVYDIPFQRNPFHPGNWLAFRMLNRVMSDNTYDLVHSHTPIGGLIGRILGYCHKVDNNMYTAHGFHFYKGGSRVGWLLFYPVEKILSYFTDTIITINEEDYAIAKKRFKMKGLHLVNGVGVNLEKFSPISDNTKAQLKLVLGLDQNKKYLIFVGELNANKNQSILIEMMEQLSKTRKDIVLLLVGKGVLLNTYRQLIKDKGLEESVLLLGYRKDIPDLMRVSDIALSSSKREGLPVNLLEAMATGLPLIVSNCRGNRDLVEDGKNGYTVENSAVDEFIVAITRILDDAVLYKQFSQCSLISSEKYSLERVEVKMKEIYSNSF